MLSRSDGVILLLTYVPCMISVLRSAGEGVDPAEKDAPGGRRIILRAAALIAVGIPAVALGVMVFAFGTSLPNLQ